MAVRHFLAQGGQRVAHTLTGHFFPSTPVGPKDAFSADARRSDIDFAITRCLDFGCGDSPCGQGCNKAECRGSIALKDYIDKVLNVPIAVGDQIVVAYVPRWHRLQEVYVNVKNGITPFTFDIVAVDPSTAPLTLAAAVSGAPILPILPGSDRQGVAKVFDATIINGNSPLFFQQNGWIELVVQSIPPAVPAAGTGCGCSDCGGLCGLNLVVAPTVRRFETGCW